MLSLFKKFNIAILGVILGVFLIAQTQQAYAQEVAEIIGANCNSEPEIYNGPDAPAPCAEGMDIEDYRVKLRWKPAISELGEIFAKSDDNIVMGLNYQNPYMVDTIIGEALQTIYFRAERKGDQICFGRGLFGAFNVPVTKAEHVKRYSSLGDDFLTEVNNCMVLPKPKVNVQLPQWSKMISPTCTDYNTTASQFKWPDGTSRSFTGVVMQCVEETMLNIFYNDTVEGATDGSTSVFRILQDRMKAIIQALLVLYVIFFGYQFLIEKRGIKQGEWHWFILKASLVVYFAAGPGMTDLLPILQNFTKGMSLIVMEAGMGDKDDSDKANDALITARENYEFAYSDLSDARHELAKLQNDLSRDPNNTELITEVEYAETERDQKQDAYDLALSNYNDAKGETASFGYKYCDFRDIERENPEAYIYNGKEMSFMKLWDMVDCKLAKYLGVGDDQDNLKSPYVLTVAWTAITTTSFLLFPLTMIFLAFVILVVVRIMHIYIIAVLALMLLVYISPLLIPAVLFKFTKGMFDKWLNQIISYTLQPIIMFVFLVFMFAAFDGVMYGGNHEFTPMSENHNYNENKICVNSGDKRICKASEYANYDPATFVCDDENAIGCAYQKVEIFTEPLFWGLEIYYVPALNSLGWIFTIGMLKMILVAYLAFALLGFVEKLTGTLTNASSSAAAMSVTPKASPGSIGTGMKNAALAIPKKANKAYVGYQGSKQKDGESAKRKGAEEKEVSRLKGPAVSGIKQASADSDANKGNSEEGGSVKGNAENNAGGNDGETPDKNKGNEGSKDSSDNSKQ